ncbi:MAG TPA: hypothetical protein VM824_12990 [Thermoleophilaceae bacterium]|nr:hypothetical protein [Thermoleophilaceae bacterium]
MSRRRVVARRVIVLGVVLLQLGFIARGYTADHKEFAFQMFPESSTWRADVVRVTAHGRRVPVEIPWDGYSWDRLVTDRGLSYPSFRHHADAGLDNQLAFLRSALDWVARNTPRDHATRYLEARVTAWHNDDPPRVEVFRSRVRDVAG